MNRMLLYALPGVVGLGALISVVHFPKTPFEGLEITSPHAQAQTAPLETMTLERMDEILRDEAADLEGGQGQWRFTLEGQSIVVLADVTNNRMRIVTPVVPAETLSAQQVEAMLVANFHSSLDARYAVTNGTVVSVFVHPLDSLQAGDLRSGLQQVATLANTFGSSYSSGDLGFGPGGEGQDGGAAGAGELEI